MCEWNDCLGEDEKNLLCLPSSRLLLLPLLLLLLLLLLLRGVALLLLLLLLLLPPLLPVLPEVMMLLLVVLLLLVSAFRDGRLAGGRLAEGTLPRICIPCLRGTWFFWADGSLDSPCVERRWRVGGENKHWELDRVHEQEQEKWKEGDWSLILTRLFLYMRFISNAVNLGLAFRSPLLPPSVLMLPIDPH